MRLKSPLWIAEGEMPEHCITKLPIRKSYFGGGNRKSANPSSSFAPSATL
jgi:hypothetical protein